MKESASMKKSNSSQKGSKIPLYDPLNIGNSSEIALTVMLSPIKREQEQRLPDIQNKNINDADFWKSQI